MTSLASAEVIVFIATREPARARDFYEHGLGLRLVADEPLALVFDLPGTRLRISKVAEFTPAPYTVLGWIVADIAEAMRTLERQGVSFERYPGLAQDDRGVCTFADGTQVAWFKDPDGNTLSLTQFQAGAA